MERTVSDIEQNEAKPERGFKVTPSGRAILAYLEEHDGEAVSKAAIAAEIGRCEKTVDRLMSKLREEGYVEVESRWNERGAQLANSYRLKRH